MARSFPWPSAATALYGIIGHPVAHSLSPVIHNRAFEVMGIDAAYLAFDVIDPASALKGVKALDIKGLSVTIPYKEAVLPFLDEIDPAAERIGAVNTVINHSGRLFGANTDWIGAIRALEEVVTIEGRRFLVLGAGGSARAVCAGLVMKGGVVHVANRRPEKARILAEAVGAAWSGLDRMADVRASVLINTTSVGMRPGEGESIVDKALLKGFDVVMDIVYSPPETRLLKEAKEYGCRVVSGLKMLLYQAEAQFELWTGQKAPHEAMKGALKAILDLADF
ncbi:MAG: shikimate dehydrogenase [Dissulfurimicrobium sp.]|uniref:shikimate dehydrogenase n=3 Tax=Deltaproteobacteria incertae sedis TaxID=45456 RepID=UPI001EDA55DF|nr:shikimate dehydrogenase [Dissulfurimicrobium hydrothermale]UKL14052.1 shikimate dehydrogenase [Dissulfurimicrobium hydrothermale]